MEYGSPPAAGGGLGSVRKLEAAAVLIHEESVSKKLLDAKVIL